MHLGLWSNEAERLLLGTACQESECGLYLVEIGGGPGLGIYQMNKGMSGYEDMWENFLDYRPDLAGKVLYYSAFKHTKHPPAGEMVGNIFFATAMARVKYYRVAAPIPTTLPEQAAYYKKYWNTEEGAATVDQYIGNWNRFVGSAMRYV
jgi:hypothetical protein